MVTTLGDAATATATVVPAALPRVFTGVFALPAAEAGAGAWLGITAAAAVGVEGGTGEPLVFTALAGLFADAMPMLLLLLHFFRALLLRGVEEGVTAPSPSLVLL
jgi:hypothetical protein